MFPKALHSISFTKLVAATSLLFGMIATPALAFGPQSSSKASEWGFDFVEEFDGLQDWSPNYNGCCGYVFEDEVPAKMPKLANGGESAWVFYSGSKSTGKWIGGTSDGKKVWRGTKAATIDMQPSSASQGPTRLGVYFGNKNNPSLADGYSNFRVFYMMWMPKSHFPTYCAGTAGCANTNNTGSYTAGQDYAYFAYYKLGDASINCGMDSDGRPVRCATNDTYGESFTVLSILKNNYTNSQSGALPGLYLGNTPQGQSTSSLGRDEAVRLDEMLGEWVGVEFWIRNQSKGSSFLMDMWIYDKTGKPSHMMANREFAIANSSAHGKNWDYYVIGGNKSWVYGPTMSSTYHVDDFIIDNGTKGQIGPRYFKKIGAAAGVVPPSPPPAASGVQTPN